MNAATALAEIGRHRDALQHLTSPPPTIRLVGHIGIWHGACGLLGVSTAASDAGEIGHVSVGRRTRSRSRVGESIELDAHINIARAMQWREPPIALEPGRHARRPTMQIDFIDATIEISKFDTAMQCLGKWSTKVSAISEANQDSPNIESGEQRSGAITLVVVRQRAPARSSFIGRPG
jgi:hypothetical protein